MSLKPLRIQELSEPISLPYDACMSDIIPPPPRAFTQGVGTVFQFAGVLLFVSMMFVCCASGLLSKDWATRDELQRIGWTFSSDPSAPILYNAQRACTLGVTCGVFFGIALAGLGLGLQAQHRRAGIASVALTFIATLFWAIQTFFAAHAMSSIVLTIIGAVLLILFCVLLALSIGAARELNRDPPPVGHEILPADYKVPYSHMHQDPPEVRLARELDQRRQRLAVQQKELEMLEEKLRRKLKDDRAEG